MGWRDLWHWVREATGRGHAMRLREAARDPWRRYDLEPPLHFYGPGALDDFRHYLTGESRVIAADPHTMASWLLECRYADDPSLLDAADHWQHPCTFELLRSGDCEDYSLWVWRKLIEAGFVADFVVGVTQRTDGVTGRHAWVVFRDRGIEYVFDGVERTREQMIQPLSQVRQRYEPQVGVAADGRRFVYAGMYRAEWARTPLLLKRGRR